MSALNRRPLAAGLVTTCVLAAMAGGAASAAEPALPRDGWVSWDVPAVDNAPAWCCFSWNDHEGTPTSCKLDGHSSGYGSRNHETTDAVTVYARTVDGKLDRLRTFATSCPVEAKTPIQELTVSPDDSAHWLLAQVKAGKLAENALEALAVHRGDFARDSIVRIGTSEGSATLRSKAWFWLGITGAAGVEPVISAAVKQDPDDDVREQAVFALSRLPDERATQALIAIAEDRSLSREQRKRAVFWLGQSESTAAIAYLDKVLTAAVPRK